VETVSERHLDAYNQLAVTTLLDGSPEGAVGALLAVLRDNVNIALTPAALWSALAPTYAPAVWGNPGLLAPRLRSAGALYRRSRTRTCRTARYCLRREVSRRSRSTEGSSAPALDQERLHGLHRRLTGSAPPTPARGRDRLTTLAQASLTSQNARSLGPASHPASRPRRAPLAGRSRTGLAPAGRPELLAPTSCGPPFLMAPEPSRRITRKQQRRANGCGRAAGRPT
jgi:hypothetical protein